MLIANMDREDVKHALRKRHGTVGKWAESKGLKKGQVADFMRGRTSAPVAKALAAEFEIEGHDLSAVSESTKLDDSPTKRTTHRLNVTVR